MKLTKTQSNQFKKLLKQPDFDWIKKLLKNHDKAEIYLVGGIVRDILLHRESHDVDFIVRNVEINDLTKWLTKHGTVNLVGKTFGVFKFTPTDSTDIFPAFDIALPRTDHAAGTGGYRDVQTQSDPKLPISEDLARRDFTINALAWDIKNEELIDEWNGAADLNSRILKTVGSPQERFEEDYLRMLRALRFACQLDFTIEENTGLAIKRMIEKINDEIKNERVVPHETIARELMKSLVADPVKTIDLWDEMGAWQHVMPELLDMKNSPQHPEFHSEGDVWVHTRLALQKLASKDCTDFIKKHFPKFAQERANPMSPENVLAILLHDISKPETIQTPEKDGVDRIRNHEHETIGAAKARHICERMKLSSPEEVGVDIDHVAWLIRYHLIAGGGNVENMRPTTIEKYFFKDPIRGANLLIMIWADGSATLSPEGKPAIDVLHDMINRIHEILSHFKKKSAAMKLPKALVDGDEIMKKFKLKPGKQIGELLHIAREAQLSGDISTKKEALEILKKHI